MNEKAPKNPFELVEYKGMKVPQVLLESGKENNLAEYIKGWEDQKKRGTEIIIPRLKTEKHRTEIRSAENWYYTGAAKYWSLNESRAEGDSTNNNHYLDQQMEHARKFPGFIPNEAWPAKKDNDPDSDTMDSEDMTYQDEKTA